MTDPNAEFVFQQKTTEISRLAEQVESIRFFNLISGPELLATLETLLPEYRVRKYPPTVTPAMFMVRVLRVAGLVCVLSLAYGAVLGARDRAFTLTKPKIGCTWLTPQEHAEYLIKLLIAQSAVDAGVLARQSRCTQTVQMWLARSQGHFLSTVPEAVAALLTLIPHVGIGNRRRRTEPRVTKTRRKPFGRRQPTGRRVWANITKARQPKRHTA